MKAEELMVGDFLRFRKVEPLPDNYVKIHAIKYDYDYQFVNDYLFDIVFLSSGHIQYNYSLRSFEPIPLTPEILEKNLGVLERSSDGYNLVINSELILSFHLEATLDVWIAQPRDWPHLTYSLPLPRYVHELQHALRLCGIEKEIEL